jgi:hypothetical protein
MSPKKTDPIEKVLKQTEQSLVNACLNLLNTSGHFVWRNNTGVVKSSYTTKKGVTSNRIWRAGIRGSSDILGIAEDGKFIAIECKIKPNKPSFYQTMFLQDIKDHGGYAIVAYSTDDIKQLTKGVTI